jgi:hypothetical protein
MNTRNQRLLIACLALIGAGPAYAYIDPGTGSALIQGLVAAVAAIGVTLKLYWHRIIGFLGLKKADDETLPSDTESDDKS